MIIFKIIFGIVFPLIITVCPVIFLIKFGTRKIRCVKGTSMLSLTLIALLMGLICPLIAMQIATEFLFFLPQQPLSAKGSTDSFVYIGIGIIVEVLFIPLTAAILKIIEVRRLARS